MLEGSGYPLELRVYRTFEEAAMDPVLSFRYRGAEDDPRRGAAKSLDAAKPRVEVSVSRSLINPEEDSAVPGVQNLDPSSRSEVYG